jgi:hypothetical protein
MPQVLWKAFLPVATARHPRLRYGNLNSPRLPAYHRPRRRPRPNPAADSSSSIGPHSPSKSLAAGAHLPPPPRKRRVRAAGLSPASANYRPGQGTHKFWPTRLSVPSQDPRSGRTPPGRQGRLRSLGGRPLPRLSTSSAEKRLRSPKGPRSSPNSFPFCRTVEQATSLPSRTMWT